MIFHLHQDPMASILKFDLDIAKMYLYTKNEVPSRSGSKVMARTVRHTRLKLLPIRKRGW